MTNADQQAIIGRAVQELSDCKKTLACREHQLREAGRRLESLSRVLDRPPVLSDEHLDRILSDVPTAEGIREIAVDYRKQFHRARELRKTLQDFGLDLGFNP